MTTRPGSSPGLCVVKFQLIIFWNDIALRGAAYSAASGSGSASSCSALPPLNQAWKRSR